MFFCFFTGNEKLSPKITALPKLEEWTNTAINLSTISQGHHSFPRVQVPKEESKKQLFDNLGGPKKDQLNPCPEKPKRMSLLNKQHKEEPNVSDFLIIPPPEAFRDTHIVDKRHSVTDPTDSREVRLFERFVLKPAVISEHKEAPAALKQYDQNIPGPVFPRESSPNKVITFEQHSLNQAIEKPSETQFKQGPPTAPKPRTLPPHIIIKTSKGDIPGLDPQKRPRTFSAHERSTDKTNESTITNVLHSKEQERARQEALQKLGLEKKTSSQENSSILPSKAELSPAPHGNKHGENETKRKCDVPIQQETTDPSISVPVQPLAIPQKATTNIKNEEPVKNRLSMKSNLIDKPGEPANGTLLVNQKETHILSPGPIIGDIVERKHSEKASIQEKSNELTTSSLTDVHGVTDSKNAKSEIHKNTMQLNTVLRKRNENVSNEPDHRLKEADLPDSAKLQTSTSFVQAHTVPEKNPVLGKTSGHVRKPELFQGSIAKVNKTGSLENINNLISANPRNRFSFSPPKEPYANQHNPKAISNDGKGRPPVDKSDRHSTHFDPSDEPYLRLPQGSVPGLRQISIKSNTLERSGVGLSSSLPSIEKGGSSFFKKPFISGNFLRNNRQRPASLGTGKDFANLEPSTGAAESTEKNLFFSRPSRQPAPVTSVKIAPKGSTDEHRREALKKLGILKE